MAALRHVLPRSLLNSVFSSSTLFKSLSAGAAINRFDGHGVFASPHRAAATTRAQGFLFTSHAPPLASPIDQPVRPPSHGQQANNDHQSQGAFAAGPKVVSNEAYRNAFTVLEANVSTDVRVLVITGTMGSGKTTMLGEASDLLAIPNSQVIVCRLRAALGTVQSRVSQRELGMCRDAFIARVAELEAILDAASIEHFSVITQRAIDP
jgi:hypothetical protein